MILLDLSVVVGRRREKMAATETSRAQSKQLISWCFLVTLTPRSHTERKLECYAARDMLGLLREREKDEKDRLSHVSPVTNGLVTSESVTSPRETKEHRESTQATRGYLLPYHSSRLLELSRVETRWRQQYFYS